MNQTSDPKNIVANIAGKKIYLDDVSSEVINVIKELGAFQMAYGSELIWQIKCTDEGEVIKTLQELNLQGFLFAGGPAGSPAADVFALLLKKKSLSHQFREVRWRGPGDWFIIKR